MLPLSEIVSFFETVAPSALQEDYDNSGLIVGHPDKMVHKALLCLDSTEDVVNEAIHLGCDIIIAHHPIVFRGLKRFNGSDYVQRAVMQAIRHDIAIYACHTNLDNVLHKGVNERIAKQLGLENLSVLQPVKGRLQKLVVFVPDAHAESVRNAIFEAGAGTIGNYDECSFNQHGEGTFRAGTGANPFTGVPGNRHSEAETRIEVVLPVHRTSAVVTAMKQKHPYEEVAFDLYPLNNSWQQTGSGLLGNLPETLTKEAFLAHLKQKMELPLVRFTNSQSSGIKKIAVCGGAGSFLIRTALQAGADAYITSDVKYHEFFDAEDRMMLCDIGHFESEKYTIDLFGSLLSEKFPNFATIFSKAGTNPVQYYY